MTDPDIDYPSLIGQYIGVLGMLVVTAIMFIRRAKERRDKAKREADGSPTPLAAPGQDRPDWHGAPAGKRR
jgi:hypothetical protein